jgi:hypothetical protein
LKSSDFAVSHCGIESRGVIYTAGSDLDILVKNSIVSRRHWKRIHAVPMIPLDQIPRSYWYRGIRSRENENDYWLPYPLKGNHGKKKYIGKHHIYCTVLYIVTRKRKY